MPLSNGTRLGPYEIAGPLGAGGMGEVYRARDTRLDRSVAIKVIPSHLAEQSEVRQRFEREARAVSGLNHPNICVLHDIGHEGSTHYFVMELLEGETLAERLEKGPMPPDEFLPVAIQIADALAVAHRAGIVHRDLKPGNIILTRSGAKLLDFGLARATGLAAAPGSGLTKSPTLTRPLTAEGTIVGTFQYMAPEQLEGRDADARTDIFAFGAVLYEMATGQRAFEGTSQASLIASIIKEQPRPMSEIVPLTPPALEHVVRRCLAKQPDERWQNAYDVKHQLEWLRNAGSQAGIPAPVAVHRRKLTRALAITAILSTIAALALFSYMATHRPLPRQAMRFSILPPPGHIFDGSQSNTAVSPDGSMIACVAFDSTGATEVWVRRMDSSAATRVPNTANAVHLFWSPDGKRLAFFANDKLRCVSIPDGSAQTLADCSEARGGSWGRNGDIVFQPAPAGPLMHVRASGGDVHAVTAIDTTKGEDAHRFPSFLPDGNHFLFSSLPGKDGLYDVRIGSLDGKMTGTIARAESGCVYAEPGYILYTREGRLFAQRLDVGTLKVSGEPIPLGEDGGQAGTWSAAPAVSVSSNGVLVHTAGGWPPTTLTWVDRSGRQLGRLPAASAVFADGSFSPDGSMLSLSRTNTDGTSDLWLVDIRRTLATRFTFVSGDNSVAKWSPDGKQIVFASSRGGRENLFVKPANSASEETMLFDSGALFTKPEVWLADGSGIVYSTLSRATGLDLWLYLIKEKVTKPLLHTRFNEGYASFSPDGKWMCYMSNETGHNEVYVRSFPDMGEKYRISDDRLGASDSGIFYWSCWRSDGTEIVFPGRDLLTVVSVTVSTHGGFHAETPRTLIHLPLNTYYVAVTPDGQKFLSFAPDTGGIPPAHSVVLNWTALLRQK
jgi:serine/threonine protein kinase